MRKMLSGLVAIALSLALTSTSAQSAPVVDGYYLLAYSGDIYRVSSGGTTIRYVSYDEWSAAGFPAPRPAPTEYVRYVWSPSITAVTRFDPDSADTWMWEYVDFPAWVRAGSPVPQVANFIYGSYFYKWATSNELFVEDPGGVNHHLTFAEWQATGPQPFVARSDEGFVKLSWSGTPEIARMSSLATGRGAPISFTAWVEEALPTPRIVSRVTRDQFYRNYNTSTIWYAGPTMHRPITYPEWQAAGAPAPLLVNVPSTWLPPASWQDQDVQVLPTSERVVALTFDAGASNVGVASILETLARYNVDATFFVTGQFARMYPASVRAMVGGGHPVGNHSDTHPEFPDLTNDQIRSQLAAADYSIITAGARASRPLFRFPYGARTTLDIAVVNDQGYVPFRWTVDSLGWQGTSGGQTAASVRDRVLAAARPGAIVLMHVGANPDDGSTLDAAALPEIIQGFRAAGYRFVNLSAFVP